MDALKPGSKRMRVTWLVLPAYLVLSVLWTWPLVLHFATAIPSRPGPFDPCMQAFLMGWDAQTLFTAPLHLFHLPIFHPEPRALTYMDTMFGETAAAAPAFLVLHSVASGYNFVFLLSFALSGWATYRLTRSLGVSRVGAFLSGLFFAFCPYRNANRDLLNQLQTQFIPLGLWFALRYLKRLRARDAWGTVGVLVAQAYFGWYYTFYLAVALGIVLLVGWWARRRISWRTLGTAAVASALLVAPIAIPYALEHRSLPEFHRTLGESALYSADVMDYVTANDNAWLAERVGWPIGPQSYWPGLVAALLAMVGCGTVWARRAWDGMVVVAVTIASFILSLGPILHAAGHRIWIPLPYAVLYYVVPGFSGMRAPARFAVLVALGISVLAGLGYQAIRERWTARPLLRRSFACAAFALAILFAWPKPLTTVVLPSPGHLPPVYEYLVRSSGRAPILEFPVPARDADENETHAIRQFYVLFHHHPRLDGASGFVSRRYRAFRSTVQSFPRDEAMNAAVEMGAALIIVHYGDYPAAERQSLRQAVAGQPRLRTVAEFGDDCLYEIRGAS